MGKIFLCILLFILTQFGGTLITNKFKDKRLGKRIRVGGTAAAALLFLGLLIGTSIYTTTDQQIGFVNQFGVNTPFTQSGLKFKTPFISNAYVFPGTTQSMTIGYVEEREDSEEYDANTAESSMITSDFNFIEVDAYIEYQIVDAIAYHFATADPVGILRNAALTAIKNNVGLTPVDDVMTTGKAQLEAQITESIIAELETHNTGLSLVKVSIQDTNYPNDNVKKAFDGVETAKQEAEKMKNQAKEYEFTHIPQAEAEATKIVTEADAARTERVNAARAEVSKFEAIWEQYSSSDVVREKLYYDTLVEILPNMDIIISPDGKTVFVRGKDSDITAAGAAGIGQ